MLESANPEIDFETESRFKFTPEILHLVITPCAGRWI